MQASQNHAIVDFVFDGQPLTVVETIAQDAGRSTALAKYTVMHRVPSTRKWVPFTQLIPTPATLVSGALGSNLAAFQAVADGEFTIPIDGTDIDVTALDFTGITSLPDIPGVINAVIAAYGVMCSYDETNNIITFYSIDAGAAKSIGVLKAVSGGGGTDISGVAGPGGFLNAATGTGTATAGTSQTPDGIYTGAGATAAEIVAGDVTLSPIMKGGMGCRVYSDKVVFENSITLNSILVAENLTVQEAMEKRNIYMDSGYAGSAYES
jgi:hypothetical protein